MVVSLLLHYTVECSLQFRTESNTVDEDVGDVEVFVDATCTASFEYCFTVQLSDISTTCECVCECVCVCVCVGVCVWVCVGVCVCGCFGVSVCVCVCVVV